MVHNLQEKLETRQFSKQGMFATDTDCKLGIAHTTGIAVKNKVRSVRGN